MKSITEVTRELIVKKGKGVTNKEIITKVGGKDYDPQEIQAIIYADLITDGQFFLEKNKWNLKENFALKEINKIRSQSIIDEMVYSDEKKNLVEEEVGVEEDIFEEKEIDVDKIINEDDFDALEIENVNLND